METNALPELTGSSRQVAWAADIRTRLAPAIEERIALLEQHVARDERLSVAHPGNEALAEQLACEVEELAYLRAFLASPRADLWIAHARYRANDIWIGRGVGTAKKYGLPQNPGFEVRS